MATVSTIPWKPLTPPTQLTQDTTFISVSMPAVIGQLTGGSTLTSYNLQYQGVNTDPMNFTTLMGENPYSLTLAYTKNGLITN